MPVNRGLYVRNLGTVGTTPIEARLIQAAILAENSPGVPRQGLLGFTLTDDAVKTTANMSFDVSPMTVAINRASGEGIYMVTVTGAAFNIATTAAPGTGSRFDLIYIKQNDPDKGDADNTATIGVIQGTSSTGTPTKPYANVPAGGYVLAEAQIYSGTTATNGGANTITQVWRHTALRGSDIPVRNATERAEITTPVAGQTVKRLDLTGSPVEEYNGTAWATLDDFSQVNTSDSNWTYRGGLYRNNQFGVPRVQLNLMLTRTGGNFALTTSAITAFAALIPAGWRPVGYSVSTPTILNTSAGAEKWGLVVRIDQAGNFTIRTDTGTTTLATGDKLYVNMEWVQ